VVRTTSCPVERCPTSLQGSASGSLVEGAAAHLAVVHGLTRVEAARVAAEHLAP
jgi:hypothetical protein